MCAYTDLTIEFNYKDLLTWQSMDKLAENDNYFKTLDATVTGQWTFDNDDTHTTVQIRADGVLAASKYGLHVYSDAAQITSPLAFFHMDNVGSDKDVIYIDNDGTGSCIFSHQSGNGVDVYIDNDGTNHALYIRQDGVLGASKYALYVYSNADQDNSYLTYIHQANAASSAEVAYIRNVGTGSGLWISQDGVLGAGDYGLAVWGTAINNASPLVKFCQDHATSDQDTTEISNDGTGRTLFLDQNGNGIALDIDTEVASLGAAFQITPAGASPDTFAICRNDNVTGNVVMKLGGGHFSVNSNRPYFRASAPGVGAVGDNIATSDGDTGGAGSAGGGNQYFELQIGATTFKVLHDGTV